MEEKKINFISNGTHFVETENKLILSSFPYIYLIYGYPEWRAFYLNRKNNKKGWKPFRPEIDVYRELVWKTRICETANWANNYMLDYKPLTKPIDRQLYIPFIELDRQMCEDEGMQKFFELIPAKIKSLCAPFPQRQWSLISSCISNPMFIDLLKSNPALAMVIANLWVFNNKVKSGYQHRFIKKRLGLKQKLLAEIAGFPQTESMVKLLKRIKPQNATICYLLRLQKILSDIKYSKRVLKLLSHLKNIDGIIMLIATHPKIMDIVSDGYVNEISKLKRFRFDTQIYFTLLNILRNAEEANIKIPVITSYEKMEKIFAETERRRSFYEVNKIYFNKFPAPPLPDNTYIKALKTPIDLVDWGESQKNCIRTFASSIVRGYNYYFSVVIGKHEATLEILMCSNRIRLGRMLGPCNVDCVPEIREVVNSWFTGYMNEHSVEESPGIYKFPNAPLIEQAPDFIRNFWRDPFDPCTHEVRPEFLRERNPDDTPF
jgi:hypothetical protein